MSNSAPQGPGSPGDAPGYRFLEEVGRGGFGVVYRAYQEHLGRDVAVKVLTMPGADAKAMERFHRECRLTGRLTGHPNVVTVLDTGTTRSGHPYMTMAYFEHGSLAGRLARDGVLPVHEALHVGVKIAGALAAAHQAGILHRDVKPQNILISGYGEPALADFGVARLLDTLDMSSRTDALTPYHAAPEVLEGWPYGETADIYSLGSTLYQLLAGQPAFKRDTSEGIAPLLLRIISEPLPGIPRPDIPPQVMDAIRQAMAKRPQDRFQQAGAFAARMQEIQAELWMPVTELPRSLPGAALGRAVAPELLPAQARTITRPRPAPGVTPSAAPPDRAAPPAPSPERTPETGRTPGAERMPVDSAAESTPHDGGAPSGPQLAETVTRHERQPAGQPPPAAEGRRFGAAIAAALAVVIAAAAVGVVLAVSRSGKSPAAADGRSSGAPAASPVPASELNAARPAALKVVDDRTSAVLTWTVPPGGQYPLAVQRSPTGSASSVQLVSGTGATRTTTVTGLDPAKGYCFEVGAVVRMANPSTVAWSRPACIRGATSQPAP